MSSDAFADNPDPFHTAQDDHEAESTELPAATGGSKDLATSLAPNEPGRPLASNNQKIEFADEGSTRRTGSHALAPTQSDESASSSHGQVVKKVKSAAQKLKLESVQTSSVSRLFNPTAARIHVRRQSHGDVNGTSSSPEQELSLLWRSRDQRKGRGSIAVPYEPSGDTERFSRRSRKEGRTKRVTRGIIRMLTTFPYWDMAFWSGWSYTVGSALFVIDGCFSWVPLAFPYTEFEGESKWGVPLCFFFGALFYQLGAVIAYLEAVNYGSFHGSAMRRLLEGHEKEQKEMLDEKLHDFMHHMVPHHRERGSQDTRDQLADQVDPEAGWATKDRSERPGSIYPDGKAPAPRRGGMDLGGDEQEGSSSEYTTWRWFPSWQMLKTHHVYEIGYLATAIQLFGVTLYGITSIVILPGILDSLNWWQTDGAYWIPQVVAAACFLIASLMFMFETQEKWWRPEIAVLGWWIGVWSTIGSVGFELCAGFGPAGLTNTGYEYQSSLSSTWGSAAYLIGSMLQWYEAVNKHPVQELFDEPGEMKTWQIHPI